MSLVPSGTPKGSQNILDQEFKMIEKLCGEGSYLRLAEGFSGEFKGQVGEARVEGQIRAGQALLGSYPHCRGKYDTGICAGGARRLGG